MGGMVRCSVYTIDWTILITGKYSGEDQMFMMVLTVQIKVFYMQPRSIKIACCAYFFVRSRARSPESALYWQSRQICARQCAHQCFHPPSYIQHF